MLPVLRPRRCLLFVPANRPDRYAKALSSGADCVCIDLEDAVAFDRKDEGRDQALAWLPSWSPQPVELVLRINSVKTAVGLRDLMALLDSGGRPDALMLPKLDSPEEVRWVDALLGERLAEVRLIPMIETVEGLAAAEAIARASSRAGALLLGGVDLSTELGCTRDWDAMHYARSRTVHAAALARIDVMDMPFLDVNDLEALRQEARLAARLGFTGKAVIHPSHVAPVLEAFSPAPEEIEWARRIVEAYERNRGGVLLVDGKLVERPVIRAAQRVLAIEAAARRGEAHSGAEH